MKRFFSFILCFLTIFFCAGCNKEEENSVLKKFDIEEKAEAWSGTEASLEQNEAGLSADRKTLYVTFKKTEAYPVLTSDDFKTGSNIPKISSVDYVYTNRKGVDYVTQKMWEADENFRQTALISFSEDLSVSLLVKTIRALENNRFLKKVEPLYPPKPDGLSETLKTEIESTGDCTISDFYGFFNENPVLKYTVNNAIYAEPTSPLPVCVADITFEWETLISIGVYADGEVYNVGEGLRAGLLTETDIFWIYFAYKQIN